MRWKRSAEIWNWQQVPDESGWNFISAIKLEAAHNASSQLVDQIQHIILKETMKLGTREDIADGLVQQFQLKFKKDSKVLHKMDGDVSRTQLS